jgi:hypothetical protein
VTVVRDKTKKVTPCDGDHGQRRLRPDNQNGDILLGRRPAIVRQAINRVSPSVWVAGRFAAGDWHGNRALKT